MISHCLLLTASWLLSPTAQCWLLTGSAMQRYTTSCKIPLFLMPEVGYGLGLAWQQKSALHKQLQ